MQDERPEDAAFRAAARGFLEQHAQPRPPDDEGAFTVLDASVGDADAVAAARAFQATLHRHGWAAPGWPARWGGRDATPTQLAIWAEEQQRFEIPTRIFAIGLGMIGPTLLAHGSEAQRERYLPRLLAGEELWCQLWSEPDAGSDLAAVATRAERRADGAWRLTGRKVWTSVAHLADFGLVVAKSSLERPRHRNLSCFVLDMRAKGVTVRPLRQMTGTAEFNEVFLDEVVLPSDALVGDENDGWRVALTTLTSERYAVGLGGSPDALAVPLVRLARAVAADRTAGAAVATHAVVDAWARARLLSLTGSRFRALQAQGRMQGPEGSLLKLARSRLVSQIAGVGTALLGPAATLAPPDAPADGRWTQSLLTAPGLHLGGGTDEILRTMVAERLLGLPKEPQ